MKTDSKKKYKLIALPVVDEASAKDDADAGQEKKIIDQKTDYFSDTRRKNHQRSENLKDIRHVIAQLATCVVAGLALVGVVIWAIHLFAPTHWHWLTTDQMFDIQKVMSSILGALFFNRVASKYLF